MKNQKLEFNAYSVDSERGIVTYAVKSHGKVFVGVAKRNGSDQWNEEIGKQIAFLRAEIQQRKFDKSLTDEFITWIKMGFEGVTVPVSPHYMRAVQQATDERKAQTNHIKRLKERLEEILNQLK